MSFYAPNSLKIVDLLRRSLWPSRPAGRSGKVNVLILATPNRVAVRPSVAAHNGIAATEVQASGARAIHRARPVVAARTNIAERTIAAVAVARHRQFQRRAIRSRTIVTAPTATLCIPLCLCGQPKSSRARIVHTIHPLPQIIILRRPPVIRTTTGRNNIPMPRRIGGAECTCCFRISLLMTIGRTSPLVQIAHTHQRRSSSSPPGLPPNYDPSQTAPVVEVTSGGPDSSTCLRHRTESPNARKLLYIPAKLLEKFRNLAYVPSTELDQ